MDLNVLSSIISGEKAGDSLLKYGDPTLGEPVMGRRRIPAVGVRFFPRPLTLLSGG